MVTVVQLHPQNSAAALEPIGDFAERLVMSMTAQAVALVGRVGRDLHVNLHARVKGGESGELGAHDERILRCRPNGDAPARFEGSDTGVGFQKAMLGRRQGKNVLENMIGRGEPLHDIAAVKLEMGTNVGALDGFDLGEISETRRRQLDRFMDQGRPRL